MARRSMAIVEHLRLKHLAQHGAAQHRVEGQCLPQLWRAQHRVQSVGCLRWCRLLQKSAGDEDRKADRGEHEEEQGRDDG